MPIFNILPPSSMPVIGIAVSVIVVLYIILFIAWLVFSKDKSFKKFINDAIPFLFAGLILYFWYMAAGWESILSDDWPRKPELSNLSAILEYTKALVKTVMLSGITIVAWLFLKKKNKD